MRASRVAPLLTLLCAGCLGRTAVVDTPDVPRRDAAADGYCAVPWAGRTVVVARFGFVRPDATHNGSVEGFDLDGRDNTDGVDSRSCSQPDSTSADGTRGIDNALAQLLPIVDAMNGGALDGAIQAAINNGQLLFTVSTDLQPGVCDDQDVTLSFRRATGMPLIGADGLVNPGQTFDQDRSVEVATMRGHVRDGVLVESEAVTLPLPIAVLDAHFVLNFYHTRFRLRLREDGGMDGMLGGGINREELYSHLAPLGIGDGVRVALQGALATFADLDSDGRGHCASISGAMQIEARRAYVLP